MGYQDEPSFPRQIVCRQVPARQVQVVGWLVDQQETVVSQEEQRQEESGLLPVGERTEGVVQDALVQVQQVQLPQQPPPLQAGVQRFRHLLPGARPIRHRKGEIVEGHRG